MHVQTTLALVSLVGSAFASSLAGNGTAGYNTTDPLAIGPDNANCERHFYPVTVSANNTLFSNLNSTSNYSQPFITGITQQFLSNLPGLSNFSAEFLSNGTMQEVSNTYNISGTLCTPKLATKSNGTVQFLIHGVGFDSSYWNFRGSGVPENYSYVRAAADAGYTTFRYDRLATGLSEHPEDGYE